MKIVDNDNIVAFDCDDTLVMWDSSFDNKTDGKILIIDPYDGSFNYLKPHRRHVALLKKYKGRGCHVRVWSAAGYQWAKAVVEALQLELWVDSVETKPSRLIDDLTPNEIFTSRIYLKDI